jgi:hypothetical protein
MLHSIPTHTSPTAEVSSESTRTDDLPLQARFESTGLDSVSVTAAKVRYETS